MFLPEWLHRTFRIPYMLKFSRRGKGPVVVFLHGLASYQGIWAPTEKKLASKYTCITLDLLGHGQSPKPTHMMYTVDDHLRSIRWTLFWHGVFGRFSLVGHSMGSVIGLHYAAKYPKRMSRIIACALPIYKDRSSLENRKRFEGLLDASYLRFYQVLRTAPKSLVIRSANRLVKLMPSIDEQTIISEETWYPVVSSLQNTIEKHTIPADIAALREDLPVTLIYGSIDNLVITANLKQAFADRPNTRFVRIFSGHEVTHSMTRAIVEAVEHE